MLERLVLPPHRQPAASASTERPTAPPAGPPGPRGADSASRCPGRGREGQRRLPAPPAVAGLDPAVTEPVLGTEILRPRGAVPQLRSPLPRGLPSGSANLRALDLPLPAPLRLRDSLRHATSGQKVNSRNSQSEGRSLPEGRVQCGRRGLAWGPDQWRFVVGNVTVGAHFGCGLRSRGDHFSAGQRSSSFLA